MITPGATDAIASVRALGRRTVFLSNNPTRDPRMYADKLGTLGISTPVKDIVTPVVTVPRWLQAHHPGAGVVAISEEPLMRALAAAGVRLTEEAGAAEPGGRARRSRSAVFVRFGLPPWIAIVYLVGLLEVVSGLMLGLLTRLTAAALAANMAGAVLTAGIAVGGPIHLGLAPALLLATLYLLWAGPGAPALDVRLDAPRYGCPSSTPGRPPPTGASGARWPARRPR
jgi:uncharacterized membrane protein YphA (DoxX/SURF4 family)